MRWIPAFAALLPLAGAGCLDDGGGASPQDSDSGVPRPEGADNATSPFDYEALPEFCASENDTACMFWDDFYHEFVLYHPDTVTLDVVIVPPPGPDLLGNIAAVRQAVQAWADGVQELGADWFRSNYTLNVYAVGVDVPTLEAVADPEVIVLTTAMTPGFGGVAIEPKALVCSLVGQSTLRNHPTHRHGGVEVMASDCTGTGFLCTANTVGDALVPFTTYDIVAHEFGHCLGAGHVGDSDFRARYVPVEDIMSYQSNPAHVHCVSNLNVRVLEGVYADLLDRPE